MFKTILRICFGVFLFLAVLYVGGYSWDRFKSETHMKDPKVVYQPIINQLPDVNLPSTDDGSTIPDNLFEGSTETDSLIVDNSSTEQPTSTDDDGSILYNSNINVNTKDDVINGSASTIIAIDDKNIDMAKQYTLSILDWIVVNWSTNANVQFFPNNTTATVTNTTEVTTEISTEVTTESVTETATEATTEGLTGTAIEILDELNTEQSTEMTTVSEDLLYDNILSSKDELNALIATINTVDKLPEYDDYDRTTYEKPVKSYKLDGAKVNRNDYAWKTSKYYNKDDNTYMCPYTGTIIKDEDDGKIDNDYGNLDYDHIVPLKSTYIRGAKDWTDEQKNEYAYNQWVGVDVLNSANRSKSDKGPTDYLPDINIDDYCFTWLVICSKYKLAMTKGEINVCKENIEISLDNGEPVEYMGGTN